MKLRAIVIHTAAAPKGQDSNAAAIRHYHMLPVAKGGRGWRDIAYHVVVTKDGTVEAGRKFDQDPDWEPWEYGAHAAGANGYTLGVCFTGNGDLADFTDPQKYAGVAVVAKLCRQFDLTAADVVGHREIDERLGAPNPYKTCPGSKVDCDKFRELVRLVLAAQADN